MIARLTVLAACLVLLLSKPAVADISSKVAWSNDWPRVRPWEYAMTGGLALNVAAAVFLYRPSQGHWKGGILFDEAVRDALVLNTPFARERTAEISDGIYYALALYPLLVDTAAITWGVHGASDAAFQMAMINFESYALTGALAMAAERVGRIRPMARECARDSDYDWKCKSEPDLNLSFLSGHTTIAFAGAGLMCAHHTHLPLYGGGAADWLACAAGMSAATTAGVLRVMSDNHYASDVILGAGIGIFGGYVWPMIWHYGWGGSKNDRGSLLPHWNARYGDLAFNGTVVPQLSPTTLGLSLIIDLANNTP